MTAPARSASKGLAVLIAVALSVAGVFGYGLVKQGSALPPGTSAFVDGHGVTYTAADSAYQVQLPSTPKVDNRQVTLGPTTGVIDFATVSTDDYEIGVGEVVLPMAVPPDQADSLLQDALTGGISATSGKLIKQTRITRGSLPAIEATFKADDGYTAHVLVMLGAQRIYLLFVHAKVGTDRLYKALDSSFLVRA